MHLTPLLIYHPSFNHLHFNTTQNQLRASCNEIHIIRFWVDLSDWNQSRENILTNWCFIATSLIIFFALFLIFWRGNFYRCQAGTGRCLVDKAHRKNIKHINSCNLLTFISIILQVINVNLAGNFQIKK